MLDSLQHHPLFSPLSTPAFSVNFLEKATLATLSIEDATHKNSYILADDMESRWKCS